jgi:aminopeptidase
MDPRLDKLAELLVNFSIDVQPGEWVRIISEVSGLPLVDATYRHVLLTGGHPTVQIHTDSMNEMLLKYGNDEQVTWHSPITKPMFETVDAQIVIRASSNTRSLNNVDPHKQQLQLAANRENMITRRERAAQGNLRWVITQFPCPAYAQDADMSLTDYEDFVYRATFADQDNPIAAWEEIRDRQQVLVDWLAGKSQVVVKGPHVDLTLSIDGRTFINSHGKFNMPCGEIFTCPVENSANGWARFTYPAVRNGREVEGVAFEFADGKVVKATAKKNEAFLLSQLDTDEGARYLGEFAIGTNYGIQRFTKNILFDEKIGGTIHMAVGSANLKTGGKNRSALHWDFICDMREDSEIRVDGELFYRNGQFQL